MKFNKVLIANRGEIACRIIRTCKELGLRTVAVYSDADSRALHVSQADEAVHIGAPESNLSYLAADRILDAARKTAAQAIHPGYGFLSENADFASTVASQGLTFIGPRSDVMKKLGDKIEAKKLAAQTSVPLVPGLLFTHDRQEAMEKEAKAFAKTHGYPIMVKAAAGGGGRGMRRVRDEASLAESLAAATREAKAAFGDGRLFIERLVEEARHVEVQIIADDHGTVISLFDRDCSMQRNHQKVIEEAPAPNVSGRVRSAMHEAARNLCKAAGYTNAGTVEFLVDRQENFYFLEVNSRLQVEHPVTEAITGLDLVELQLRVASGERLDSLVPSGLQPRGAAIECRICAERPEENFAASTGRLAVFAAPQSHSSNISIRFDSGFQVGDTVTHYYDSMLAKLIVHADTREEAIVRTREALERLSICGVQNNLGFLLSLVNSDLFHKGQHHIQFAPSLLPTPEARVRQAAFIAAIPTLFALCQRSEPTDAWQRNSQFRIMGNPRYGIDAQVNGLPTHVTIECLGGGNVEFRGADFRSSGKVRRLDDTVEYASVDYSVRARIHTVGNDAWVMSSRGTFLVHPLVKSLKKQSDQTDRHSGLVASPLPGKVAAVKASVGAKVAAGEPLLVIESMKMEHIIRSPHDAEVTKVHVRSGEIVDANAVLAELKFDA